MRPHRLELTAFGPFADSVEIDFDRLGLGGLFLMHGETGAGKTSVLDGLSFALYGRVAGVRGVNRLRSDHAAAATRTRVRLDVSIGSRRFRMTRTPAQERPKQRGSGVTVEPASVALDEWDESVEGGWLPRSTRVGEVDAELSDLIGMSAEQFHQVVLLPQGQFAKFLHSDAAERTVLLQRLFGTDRFRRVEDWLAAQRRQSKESFEEARHGVRRLVARVAQVCGQPEPEELPGLEWVADQLARATADAEDAAALAQAAALEQERAQGVAAQATDLARRQQRRALAMRREASLAEAAPELAAIAVEIEAARRAGAFAPILAAQSRRAAMAERAQMAAATAYASLPERLQSASTADLRAAAVACRETLGRLTEAAALERSAMAAAKEATDGSQAIELARRRVAALAPLQQQAPTLRAAAQTRLAAAREASVALPTAQAAADRAAEAVAAAQLRGRKAAEVSRLAADHLVARESAVELRGAFNDLRNDRIDGMIAELASKLTDDSPCPVCGALEHPDPSEVRGRQVSKADEAEASAAADAAKDRASRIGEQVAAAQAAEEAAGARLRELGCEGADPAELAAAQAGCKAAVEGLSAAAGLLVAADAEVADLDAAAGERRDEIARLEAGIASSEVAVAASTERCRELLERLQTLLGEAQDVASARREAQRLAGLVDAAESAALALEQAEAEREAADLGAAQAAESGGFASIEEARAAVREPAALAALESQVLAAREEAAAVAELLADPELDVALSPPAPVESAAAGARAATSAGRQAEARLAKATERVEQLIVLEQQLASRLQALEPIELAAQHAKELADLAGGIGANRLNMPLSAYVLAARLEEVAEVASIRLRAMTQGRYTLIHSDVSKGNARGGLRLMVSDAWTGQDRDTATLSGGETFLASLALALGLAEVVTASAGGAPLEALFIDEGFGTLDEETLDEVLDVLDGLREGGRLVGIVSHVPHLRDRIPSQLRVHKGTSGSWLRQSDGGTVAPTSESATPPGSSTPPESSPAVSIPSPPVINLVSEQLALLGAD